MQRVPDCDAVFPRGDGPDAHALIDNLITRPEALFKGPYLEIKLPFRLADTDVFPFRYLGRPFTPIGISLLHSSS